MSVGDQDPWIDQSRVAQFNTTHWSVVLAAGQTDIYKCDLGTKTVAQLSVPIKS